MDWIGFLGSATTVASFFVFVGIVGWAYSGRRRAAFADAANAPFALPDEGAEHATVAVTTERRP